MGVEPMSPPTAVTLCDGISPYEEVTLELDCTSIISVVRWFPVVSPPTIRNLLSANRKYDYKHWSESLYDKIINAL